MRVRPRGDAVTRSKTLVHLLAKRDADDRALFIEHERCVMKLFARVPDTVPAAVQAEALADEEALRGAKRLHALLSKAIAIAEKTAAKTVRQAAVRRSATKRAMAKRSAGRLDAAKKGVS